MKILAIDSSGLVASVAVLEDDRLLAEYTIDYKKTHSQTLLPMLNEVKRMIELDLTTIDVVAVAAGPGSFTGLRIGSATAKGIAEALDKPIAEIPTMDAMAYHLIGYEGIVCPIMDARRRQVYTGIYQFKDHQIQVVRDQAAKGIDELIEEVNALGESTVFLGDGVPVFRSQIEEKVTVPFSFAPVHLNKQKAGAVAALAAIYYKEGKIQTAAEHRPDYLRVSQAERERAERLKKEQEHTK